MKGYFHAYKCETGCGHTTLVDKYYKRKLMHCAVCGTKETMIYKGTTIVGAIVPPEHKLMNKK